MESRDPVHRLWIDNGDNTMLSWLSRLNAGALLLIEGALKRPGQC